MGDPEEDAEVWTEWGTQYRNVAAPSSANVYSASLLTRGNSG